MAIYQGDIGIHDIKLGNIDVFEIYQGSKLVYPENTEITITFKLNVSGTVTINGYTPVISENNTKFVFTIPVKTESGVMSAADKVKLDETLPNQITELSNNVYTKEEINNKFDNVPTVENTYTKAEVDKAIADAIKALIPAGYELVIKKKTT
jgi:hypothetical protein